MGFLKNFKPFCQTPSLKYVAGLDMHQTAHDCIQIIACSDNFSSYVNEILMKYSLFFLRLFAHNLRNIKCLLWAGAFERIYNFIFLNYTGTIKC